ncbi:CoA-binding domain-containing protein [Mycena chlorophos]|uniref:CoA-binding domain-containing protein n=1 Tax=Mycena chlorophos TaxID=658473 RepID=A0A8H6TNH4_MYCCL|nr:CoA-binding domain-containing protein [Mycena chlorophos]
MLAVLALSLLTGFIGANASPGVFHSREMGLLKSKTDHFLSAPSFAVVGASEDETKFGTIVLKTMLEQGLDAVPVNPYSPFSEGKPCIHSLADLDDPERTSISIVTQPAVTLSILHQAIELGIPAVWLQPGAEDFAVLEFIENTNSTGTTFIHSSAHALARRQDTTPPCGGRRDLDLDTPDLISTLSS